MLYRLIRGLVRLGLRAFFREIEVRGAENLPARALLRRRRSRALARADRPLALATGESPAAPGTPG